MKERFVLVSVVLLMFLVVNRYDVEGRPELKISSPAFKQHATIPLKFTCHGEGLNPHLVIEQIPENTQSLALIVDDLDAPGGTFVHWVVYDIPVTKDIGQNSIPGKQGSNDGGGINYVSPCPPSGVHRYFFKIYALDKVLNLEQGISKTVLENVMRGHILDKAELIGEVNGS